MKQKFLHEYAEELYKHGIIEDADQRCCITPALAVTKPGASAGVFRFAQDFRAGNKFTLTDRHGLPRPIDIAHELSGAAYITEIDLASGYWNIWITKEDRYKTAFQLPDGRVYQWTRFPFGLDISVNETMYYWGVNSKMQTSHTLCSRPKRYVALQKVTYRKYRRSTHGT